MNLKGKKATLLMFRDETILRVYDVSYDEGFRDFIVNHSDLEVIINDNEHQVREKNGEYYIDHTDATLGYK